MYILSIINNMKIKWMQRLHSNDNGNRQKFPAIIFDIKMGIESIWGLDKNKLRELILKRSASNFWEDVIESMILAEKRKPLIL